LARAFDAIGDEIGGVKWLADEYDATGVRPEPPRHRRDPG
jgi:hypothetical protein